MQVLIPVRAVSFDITPRYADTGSSVFGVAHRRYGSARELVKHSRVPKLRVARARYKTLKRNITGIETIYSH